jgi:hypothetical protein
MITYILPRGRMERLSLISRALSLSVTFHVVTYFLITLQWPHTLLSSVLSLFLLYVHPGKGPLIMNYAI